MYNINSNPFYSLFLLLPWAGTSLTLSLGRRKIYLTSDVKRISWVFSTHPLSLIQPSFCEPTRLQEEGSLILSLDNDKRCPPTCESSPSLAELVVLWVNLFILRWNITLNIWLQNLKPSSLKYFAICLTLIFLSIQNEDQMRCAIYQGPLTP